MHGHSTEGCLLIVRDVTIYRYVEAGRLMNIE
jgi:hypothetical protein